MNRNHYLPKQSKNKLKRIQINYDLIQNGHTTEEIPTSYVSNTRKENICLEILRQYTHVHLPSIISIHHDAHKLKHNSNIEHSQKHIPNEQIITPKVFFSALNEYNIEKIVCSTIRPTLLPYIALYDYATCAFFVAQYLEYEPMDDCNSFPDAQSSSNKYTFSSSSCPSLPSSFHLPSPSQVLKWCKGDCFDFATVLVSFLLGAGYDAYVVHGLAPRWVRHRDQAVLDYSFPSLQSSDDRQWLYPNIVMNKNCKSKKDEDKINHDLSSMKTVHGNLPLFQTIPLDKDTIDNTAHANKHPNLHTNDYGIHAWVLIRAGKREMKEMIFVEPTTGEVFSTKSSCPYTQISSIWNAENYWINRQSSYSYHDNLKNIMKTTLFDLKRRDLWYPIFIGGEENTSKSEFTKNHAETIDKKSQEFERHFRVPCSWVNKLTIPQDSYEKKYQPNGQRVILYKNAKVELYAVGVNKQGLVSRVTKYEDLARMKILECREYFVKDRHDKLYQRKRYPLNMQYHEFYSPGNKLFIKEWIEKGGKTRTIHFYSGARTDGLVTYEEHFGSKTISYFEDRHDDLITRTIYFDILNEDATWQASSVVIPGAEGRNTILIVKVIETFQINLSSSTQDIAKRYYYFQENKIDIEYCNVDRVTKRVSTFLVHRSRDIATPIEQENIEGAQDVADAEKKCIIAVKSLHQDIEDLVRAQKQDHGRVQMKWSGRNKNNDSNGKMNNDFVNGIQNKTKTKGFQRRNEVDDKIKNATRNLDFLSPFLTNIKDISTLTKEDAISIRDACLKTFKDRILERANIMQNRLNVENAKLSQHQANYQHFGDGDGNKHRLSPEEFEKICSEATFRIKILEKRLAQHEETAVAKYKALEEKILADPRMAILSN